MVHSKKRDDKSSSPCTDFKQLLWRSGFVTVVGGQVCVNIQAACEYLHCTERTLRRWMAGNPCPRAAKLLRQKEDVVPASWAGFAFNRQDKLITPLHPHGLEREQVLSIGRYNENATRYQAEADYLRGQLADVRDEQLRKTTRAKLAQVINTLNLVIADPLFLAPGERVHPAKKSPAHLPG